MTWRVLSEAAVEPEGAPRSTRRKKAKLLTDWRIAWASASVVTFGTFLSFAYAGERRDLIADLPDEAAQLAGVRESDEWV
jgi:hypothetical protein